MTIGFFEKLKVAQRPKPGEGVSLQDRDGQAVSATGNGQWESSVPGRGWGRDGAGHGEISEAMGAR